MSNQRPNDAARDGNGRNRVRVAAEVDYGWCRESERQTAGGKGKTALSRDAYGVTDIRVREQRRDGYENVGRHDGEEVLPQLASVLVHGQREGHDAGVQDAGKNVAGAGQLVGAGPELEVLGARTVLCQSRLETSAQCESEGPYPEDGEEGGDENRVEILPPFGWERGRPKIHEDAKGQVHRHAVADCVVYRDADEQEQYRVREQIEVAHDGQGPDFGSGQWHGSLRREFRGRGWNTLFRWSDIAWVMKANLRGSLRCHSRRWGADVERGS